MKEQGLWRLFVASDLIGGRKRVTLSLWRWKIPVGSHLIHPSLNYLLHFICFAQSGPGPSSESTYAGYDGDVGLRGISCANHYGFTEWNSVKTN